MNETEKHVMAWVYPMWEIAAKYDKRSEWNDLCEALYGAIQACNQVNAMDDYEAYQTLVWVARERRIQSIVNQYKEAA